MMMMNSSLSTPSERTNFYNRSDFIVILNNLSPLRSKFDTYIQPNLHYVGLIANILCIFVMLQKQMIKRKSIVYLLHLAMSDFIFILLSELPSYLKKLKLIDYDLFKTSDLSCFFYDYRSSIFHFFSIAITTIVTIDRFNAIYNPLKSNYSILSKFPKLICLVVFVCACLLALPRGFLMVYNNIEKDCDARPFFRRHIQINGMNFTFYQLYFTFTEPIIIWFVPGLLILCMNSYVIYKIINSQKTRPKYLGFQHVQLRKELSNRRNLERILNYTQQHQQTRQERNRHFRSTSTYSNSPTPSIDSIDSTGTGATQPMVKTTVAKIRDFFKCKKNANDEEEGHKRGTVKTSSSRTNSSNEQYELLKMQKTANSLYNQIAENTKTKLRLNRCASSRSLTNSTSVTMQSTNPKLNSNEQAKGVKKISVNQISHYVTIIVLGFYFILSTIPYGVMLTFQNNLTLKLDYFLEPDEIYKDKLWLRYGYYRQLVACTKIFFVSNHCLNFFVYFLFNRMFRFTFMRLVLSLIPLCKMCSFKTKCMKGNGSIRELSHRYRSPQLPHQPQQLQPQLLVRHNRRLNLNTKKQPDMV